MCELFFGNDRLEVVTADDLPMTLARMYSAGKNCLSINKSVNERLTIVLSSACIILVYISHRNGYLCLNASKDHRESNERIRLDVGNELTPFPKNMCIARNVAIKIIKGFCVNGHLLDDVYWIKDGEKEALDKSPV